MADAQSVVDGPPAHCAMDDIEVVGFKPEISLHAQYGSVSSTSRAQTIRADRRHVQLWKTFAAPAAQRQGSDGQQADGAVGYFDSGNRSPALTAPVSRLPDGASGQT
jgi:hypothetical protein